MAGKKKKMTKETIEKQTKETIEETTGKQTEETIEEAKADQQAEERSQQKTKKKRAKRKKEKTEKKAQALESTAKEKEPAQQRTRKRPARRGVLSCFAAGFSFLLWCILVGVAGYFRGATPGGMVALVFLGLALLIVGLVLARRGRREEDKAYWSCYLGVFLNILVFALYALIYYIGIR